MAVWLWIAIGITGFFAASLVVGLLVAAILAKIGEEFVQLIEFEPLKSSPVVSPSRSTPEVTERRFADRSTA